MSWSRRDLLRAAGLSAAALALSSIPSCSAYDPGPDYLYEGAPADRQRFSHGVASGDPLTDSVILWTRIDLGDLDVLEAYVEVSETDDFAERAAATYVDATSERGGCVKIDVEGLKPGTRYYYRFRCQDQTSPVGRTQTAPKRGATSLVIGVASCSNYPAGYFHAYRHLAESNVDVIAHLGDYIYEYKGGAGERAHSPPREILTLEDYRERYAQYRTDPDLLEAHRLHPWINTWDDHESADNSFMTGANAHQPETDGDWFERLAAARQAWFEWLPAREDVAGRLYRSLGWGGLATLIVLDTRVEGREQQTREMVLVGSEDRQLLGEEQEAWLLDQIRSSKSTWKVLLQQVVMGAWGPEGDIPLNDDAWDGYPAARRRVMEAATETTGVLVLTGDVHSSWAHELALDPNTYETTGAVALEAVTPGITSGAPDTGKIVELLAAANPHIRYVDTKHRGCLIIELTPEQATATWWHVPDGGISSTEPVALTIGKQLTAASDVAAWNEV